MVFPKIRTWCRFVQLEGGISVEGEGESDWNSREEREAN